MRGAGSGPGVVVGDGLGPVREVPAAVGSYAVVDGARLHRGVDAGEAAGPRLPAGEVLRAAHPLSPHGARGGDAGLGVAALRVAARGPDRPGPRPDRRRLVVALAGLVHPLAGAAGGGE